MRLKSHLKPKPARVGFNVPQEFSDDVERFGEAAGMDKSSVFREGARMMLAGYLPLLGTIPCGPLQEAIEGTLYHEFVPVLLRPRADLGDFLLEASGDSNNPEVHSGDFVMLRPHIEPSEGDLCAVQVYENEDHVGPCTATLKRFFPDPVSNKATLRPFNTAFPEMVVPLSHIEIIGVMRGLIRGDGGS